MTSITARPTPRKVPVPPTPVVRRPLMVRYYPAVLVSGMVLVLALLVAHVSIGTADISWQDVVRVLTGQQVDSVTHTIVYDLRLPRALVAVLAGAMLALAGAIMQALTRNPLAEPDLTGASTGAVFFAVLWLSREMIGWNVAAPNVAVPFVAMVGSLFSGGLVYLISRGRGGQTNTVRLVLTGVVVSAIMRSLTSLILLKNQNAASGILLWIIGSLNGRTWVHWDTVWPWALVTVPSLAREPRRQDLRLVLVSPRYSAPGLPRPLLEVRSSE